MDFGQVPASIRLDNSFVLYQLVLRNWNPVTFGRQGKTTTHVYRLFYAK